VSGSTDRRRLQRVKLIEPLPGNIDGQRVFIVDVSRQGLRVAHQESLGPQGERRRIEFSWEGHHVAVEGTLTHTRVQRVGVASHARSIYHSGFTIATISTRSEQVLREMIAWHVERALDEQKANARGVPATVAISFQTGHGREYVRHIFGSGKWHEVHTTDARQPSNGFTISAAESEQEVRMLRSAWEAGDNSARKMIQKLAELSISRAEGVPTRRYTP
jgi:hypothetical protein